MELSIVIPCLNESETLRVCIQKAKAFIEGSGVQAEIIIADNGSTDDSQEIAKAEGAIVKVIAEKGYGNAIIGGVLSSRGKYIIMGDGDDSYDFRNLDAFIKKLREGYDLVMGNRFQGGIEPGAMPWLHKYLGNPVLSFIGRSFFKTNIGDFHCGLRGFSREAFDKMELQCGGMEFASEMIVKSSLKGMKITEIPTTLKKDGRSRPSHLRTWRDGWRHLRFLLLSSPGWLFFIPGIFLVGFGGLITAILMMGSVHVFNVIIDIHTLLYSAMLIPIGFQLIFFNAFAVIYGTKLGLLPPHRKPPLHFLTLERGIGIGFLLILVAIVLFIQSVIIWKDADFTLMHPSIGIRIIVPSVLCLVLGFQFITHSFMISFLKLNKVNSVSK